MPNNIELSSEFLAAYQESLFAGEKTADLVNASKFKFGDAKTVQILKTDVAELKQYDRANGYGTAGVVNATYQNCELSVDLYQKYGIDKMDNVEQKMQTIASVLAEAGIKIKKTADFIRLSKIAGASNVQSATPANLATGSAVVNALDTAEANIVEYDSELSDCNLYITPTCYTLLKREIGDKSGRFMLTTDEYDNKFEFYDGMKVVVVPQTRMYVGATLNNTTKIWEATADNNGNVSPVNFMIVNRTAVACPLKVDEIKFVDNSINPDSREDLICPNIYLDAFVLDKRAKGVYVHSAVARALS